VSLKGIAEKYAIFEGLRFIADEIFRKITVQSARLQRERTFKLLYLSAALQKILIISFSETEKGLGYETMQQRMSTKCLGFLRGFITQSDGLKLELINESITPFCLLI
jgi:hypothetical protein